MSAVQSSRGPGVHIPYDAAFPIGGPLPSWKTLSPQAATRTMSTSHGKARNMPHPPLPASLRPGLGSGDDGHLIAVRASLAMGHPMTRLVVLGWLVALALGRDVAAQQQRQARDGFWFAGAFGTGWAHVSCDICQGTNRGGVSGALPLGGGVGRAVLVGAGVAAGGAADANSPGTPPPAPPALRPTAARDANRP